MWVETIKQCGVFVIQYSNNVPTRAIRAEVAGSRSGFSNLRLGKLFVSEHDSMDGGHMDAHNEAMIRMSVTAQHKLFQVIVDDSIYRGLNIASLRRQRQALELCRLQNNGYTIATPCDYRKRLPPQDDSSPNLSN